MTIFDLSHPLHPGMPVWPGDPPLLLDRTAGWEEDGFLLHRLSLGTHLGTHLDAPRHYLPDGADVAQLKLDDCCGLAQVVQVPSGPREVLSAERLSAVLPEAAWPRLLLATGWDEHYGTDLFYEDFPVLSEDAAELLARRGIRLVGLDTPSPESNGHAIHHILLQTGMVIVEALRQLRHLPPAVFFCAAPLAVTGAEGMPVRALAFASSEPVWQALL